MGVFLLILKIICIAIASLLGFVFAILLLLLFVPFRYKLIANRNTEMTEYKIEARVTWFLHFLSIFINLCETGIDKKLKIIGIDIIKLKKIFNKRREAKAKRKSNASNKKNEVKLVSYDSHTNEIVEETVSGTGKTHIIVDNNIDDDIKKCDDIVVSTYTSDNSLDNNEDNCGEDNTFKKSKHRISIKKIFNCIVDSINRIKINIKNIDNKLTTVINKLSTGVISISYYINELSDDKNLNVIKKIFIKTKKLIKHIIPRKIKGKLYLGFDDPETMGKVLAILGIMYPIYKGNIEIVPDFDESHLYGNILLKGRIRLIVLIVILLKIYFDKDTKRFIKRMKKES